MFQIAVLSTLESPPPCTDKVDTTPKHLNSGQLDPWHSPTNEYFGTGLVNVRQYNSTQIELNNYWGRMRQTFKRIFRLPALILVM